jgi:hypothetical protein
MAYCTADDVRVELGFTEAFDATTILTEAQVTAIIAQVEGVINVNLKRAGVTASAVTDADQLSFLKDLTIAGAACRVGLTYFGNNTSVNDTQPTHHCEYFREMAYNIDALSEIFTPADDGGILENQVTSGSVSESNIPRIKDDFIY